MYINMPEDKFIYISCKNSVAFNIKTISFIMNTSFVSHVGQETTRFDTNPCSKLHQKTNIILNNIFNHIQRR